MKFLSLMILLLTLVACGKESKTNSSSSSTQLSVNGLNLTTSTVSIPKAGVIGGGPSIMINGTSYQIDSSASSSNVSQYLMALSYGRAGVTPISQDNLSTNYRVGYYGSIVQGACIFNPMATCSNAVLTQLMAY
jgi:hypothetical protein